MSDTPDSYLSSRALEAQARAADTAPAWTEFATLKAQKGSYTLAALGFLNAAVCFEREGDVAAAVKAYRDGLAVARRGRLADAPVILTTRLATLLEHSANPTEAGDAYHELSVYFEEREQWFLAADAADHAGELYAQAGRDRASYQRPVDLWLRNAEYWRGKDAGDEAWSRRRAAAYQEHYTA